MSNYKYSKKGQIGNLAESIDAKISTVIEMQNGNAEINLQSKSLLIEMQTQIRLIKQLNNGFEKEKEKKQNGK